MKRTVWSCKKYKHAGVSSNKNDKFEHVHMQNNQHFNVNNSSGIGIIAFYTIYCLFEPIIQLLFAWYHAMKIVNILTLKNTFPWVIAAW